MQRAQVIAVLAAISVSVVVPAQTRPDYSGDWVLRPERSTLDQRIWAGLESGTLKLVHRDPRVELHRAFVVKGKPDESAWTMTTDGREEAKTAASRVTYSRLSWVDSILVLSERVVAPQGEATNTVEYRLIDSGRALEVRERFKAPRIQYENIYVFERR